MQVAGDAMLDGALVLQLDEVPVGPVQVLQAGTITGDFSSISANVAGLRSCERANAVMDPESSSATSYSVLVMVDKSACGGLSTPAIAGIAVGGALLLLAAITIPVCISHWKMKKQEQAQLAGLNNAL